MLRRFVCRLVVGVWACLPQAFLHAQAGGSRAGIKSGTGEMAELPTLPREVIEGYIIVNGRAEIRLKPTEIRMVLAVTSDAPTAKECHAVIAETISQLKNSWSKSNVPVQSIVEDFIAVLPIYEWDLEKRGSVEMGVEKRTAYRMQTNLHLAVANDDVAAKALTVAFEHGVTDIIAFDYWSKDLDEAKVKARDQAVKATREKSNSLLSLVFETVPPAINVQEQTTIHYPESLYHSFVNAHEEEISFRWRRETPFIRAHRPRNTYYRGLYSNGDVQPKELPMHPEISVVSTVRLYFESPAAAKTREDKKRKE